MPSFQQLKTIITTTLRQSPQTTFYIEGAPGAAKSALGLEIGPALGIPSNRIHIEHPPLRDPVDYVGLPHLNKDGSTDWATPAWLMKFARGTGPGLIIVDDYGQAHLAVQNALGGLFLDRRLGTFELDPAVSVIVTGNRAKDKAGSKEPPSQVRNRMNIQHMEVSIDDWSAWAMDNGITTRGIAFLRLRPELLNNFDPNRKHNPTPRAWAKLFQEIPESLDAALYMYACEGYVGEGAAAEWVAAKDMMDRMPSIDDIRANPKKEPVPPDAVVRYAVATALAATTDKKNFEVSMTYVDRMPAEYQVVYVMDVLRRFPDVRASKPYINWAVKNQDTFIGVE